MEFASAKAIAAQAGHERLRADLAAIRFMIARRESREGVSSARKGAFRLSTVGAVAAICRLAPSRISIGWRDPAVSEALVDSAPRPIIWMPD